MSEGSEQFALELFSRTALQYENSQERGDFMISPYSIWLVLLWMLEGASGNTLAQLQRTLRINQDIAYIREAYQRMNTAFKVNTTTVEVSTSRAMFPDKMIQFNQDYLDTVERIYQANLFPINFENTKESADIVNGFVKSATRGLIKDIVKPGDLTEAQMILISTIFFRGQWTVSDLLL